MCRALLSPQQKENQIHPQFFCHHEQRCQRDAGRIKASMTFLICKKTYTKWRDTQITISLYQPSHTRWNPWVHLTTLSWSHLVLVLTSQLNSSVFSGLDACCNMFWWNIEEAIWCLSWNQLQSWNFLHSSFSQLFEHTLVIDDAGGPDSFPVVCFNQPPFWVMLLASCWVFLDAGGLGGLLCFLTRLHKGCCF